MATSCENFLIVTHKNHNKMLEIQEAFASKTPFEAMVPGAEAFNVPEPYACEINVEVSDHNNELVVRFWTAGYFPRDWYKCLKKMGYNIKAYWVQDSIERCGKWINGRCSGEIAVDEAPKGIRDNLLYFPSENAY